MSESNGRNGYYTAQAFIDVIPDSAGIISTIAKRVGCAWHTAKKYCSEDTTPFVTVAQAYANECQRVLDMAESKCLEAVRSGDGPMIRYYLSTKGKERGYSERREHHLEGSGEGGAIVLTWGDDNARPVAGLAPGSGDGTE